MMRPPNALASSVCALLLIGSSAAYAQPDAAAKPDTAPAEPPAAPAEPVDPAPATADDDEPWSWLKHIRPGIDVISQYDLRLRDGSDGTEYFHEFEIPRIFGTITAHYEDAEARLVVESVRSASEGALIGVAGDSFVIRLREAYAGYTLFERLHLRMGLLPTFTINALQSSWAMRAVEAVGTQRVGYASPADLGASARVTLPIKLGWVGVGAYNGEGYTRRELNRGKNVELAAQIHPLASIEPLVPLSLFFSYVAGSSGTALARQNRVTGALMWTDTRIGGGASVTYAQGFQDRGDINGMLLEGWARGEPYDNILLAAQLAHWWRNLDAPEPDSILTLTASAGYRLVQPLEVMLAFDAFFASDVASLALPDLDSYRLRAITRFRFDEGGLK